jgi:hypothetical protein
MPSPSTEATIRDPAPRLVEVEPLRVGAEVRKVAVHERSERKQGQKVQPRRGRSERQGEQILSEKVRDLPLLLLDL